MNWMDSLVVIICCDMFRLCVYVYIYIYIFRMFTQCWQRQVMGNKYFVDEGKQRLAADFAQNALELLSAKLESNLQVSVSSFISDFCMPMQVVAAWKRQMVQRFGQQITSQPAWQRVLRMLLSEAGRPLLWPNISFSVRAQANHDLLPCFEIASICPTPLAIKKIYFTHLLSILSLSRSHCID